MTIKKQHTYEKVILGIELFGFAAVLVVNWLDEYLDVPFRFFRAAKTPLRPQFWFETLAILLLATAVITATLWVFRRLRFLEGFIQICAWCRKVNVGGEWASIEEYPKQEHELRSTHGICSTCRTNASKRGPAVMAHDSAA